MEITERKENNVLIVGVNGRLDANSSQDAQNKLLQAIGRGEKLVAVDCSQLDYVSSAGLRVFLTALKTINASSGKMAIFGCKDNIKQIFEISGFSSLFKLHATREDAVRSIS